MSDIRPAVRKLLAYVAAATASLSLFGGMARATDNDTAWHRHSTDWGYRLNVNLPADWKDAMEEAGIAWSDRTKLDFMRNTPDISSTDPSTTSHIVWRGTIPSGWQDACPPASTLACTKVKFEGPGSAHLADADTVFDQADSMGASSTNCALGIGTDVQTVMLHEFGHWGSLDHSTDSEAAMYAFINDCQRVPAQHDLDSMAAQYAGHSG